MSKSSYYIFEMHMRVIYHLLKTNTYTVATRWYILVSPQYEHKYDFHTYICIQHKILNK